MCGFDGRLGRNPVAIEGAHVRWHSQDGPDDLANAIALSCTTRSWTAASGQPSVDVIYVNWHTIQVFKSHGHRAA